MLELWNAEEGSSVACSFRLSIWLRPVAVTSEVQVCDQMQCPGIGALSADSGTDS